MRNVVLYVGGFKLPDRSASAQRVRENAKLLRAVGYDVVILGKLPDVHSAVSPSVTDGLSCLDVRHPDRDRRYPPYEFSVSSIRSAVGKIGVRRIYATIAYNYPPVALRNLISLARRDKFPIVAECTEWHGSAEQRFPWNVIRFLGTEYRMRVLARRAGNVICASERAREFFKGCHTLVLPFAIDASAPKWKAATHALSGGVRRFVYAGSPGPTLSKDDLPTVLRAFDAVRRAGHSFVFTIIGLTFPELKQAAPDCARLVEGLGTSVEFKGRLPHLQTIEHVAQSDFFVFLRPQNRVSDFGFPTKLAEALACGVPVIVNATSDIGRYVRSGANGYLLQRPDVTELRDAIVAGITVGQLELDAMKETCRQDNPFSAERFKKSLARFMSHLR